MNNPYLSNLLTGQQSSLVDPTPVDTTAPLSFFSSQGYYIVDGKIFRHKVFAMQEATRKKLKPTDIKWVFNNDVYDKMDWKTPSSVPLKELYRLRAQQLRDKYDYLVLSFSGGGDSTNVLDSFVLNNIHLDEVVVGWARSQTAGKYNVSLSTDAKNYLSEWDYLIEPKLKWLEKVSPRTKITIIDPYEKLEAHDPAEDIVKLTPKHNYIGYKRYRALDDMLLDRQIKYKNCSIIMGVNPPVPVRAKKHFMIYFFDVATSTWGSDYTDKGLRRCVEFFYWTPDMPEIVSAQAHALLDNLRANPEFIALVPEWHMKAKVQPETLNTGVNNTQEQLRRWMKWVLYPTYDYKNLQVDKNTSPNIVPEWFSWFYDNPHSKEIMDPHQSGIRSYQNLIDPEFFKVRDGVVHDYYWYRSKYYHIGDLP